MDRACEETDKGLYGLLLITMFSRHWIFASNHPEGIQNTPYFSETPCQWKIHSDHWRSEVSFSQVSDVDSSVCSHPRKNCYNTCGWEVGGGKICLFSLWAVTNWGIRNLGRGKFIWVKIAAKKLRTTLNKISFSDVYLVLLEYSASSYPPLVLPDASEADTSLLLEGTAAQSHLQ